MKVSKLYARTVLVTMLMMGAIFSCQTIREEPVPQQSNLTSNPIIGQAQSLFEQKQYQISFFEALISAKHLRTQWLPQWKEARSATQGSSITYFFVPLKDGPMDPIVLKGQRLYLLVVKDGEVFRFYRAAYVADDTDRTKLVEQSAQSEAAFMQDFSGALLLTNLETHKNRVILYKKGYVAGENDAARSIPVPTAKTAPAVANRTNSCGYWFMCYWSAYCATAPGQGSTGGGGVTYGTSSIAQADGTNTSNCTPPLYTQAPICASSGWQLTHSDSFYQCLDGDTDENYQPPLPPTPYTTTNPAGPLSQSYRSDIYNTLLYNPVALLLPCPGLTDAWRPLIQFRPPQAIRDKLDYLSSTGFISGWDQYYVQNLKNAAGPTVNLDRYSIQFSQLPVVNGQRLTMEQTLNYIRLNLATYSGTVFAPQTQTGQNESSTWYSNSPFGAIVRIGIPFNKGDVIVSDYTNGISVSWTFTTIHDPFSDNHPVSGTRRFGINQVAGGYEFYIMGADRITGYGDALFGYLTNIRDSGQNPLQFRKGDELWTGLINNLRQNLFSPQNIPSFIPQPVVNRPDFGQLQYILNNNLPLSNLDC